jgi:hypothetical protein
MRSLPELAAYGFPVAVVLVGACGAAVVWSSRPAAQSPDAGRLAALAAAARPSDTAAAASLPAAVAVDPGSGAALTAAAPTPLPAGPPVVTVAPAGARGSVPALRWTAGPASGPTPNPVDRLALLGVTHEDGQAHAWLVDLPTRRREQAAAGERAFGLRVVRVLPEAVQLRDARNTYTLHLGEKQIGSGLAVAAASASPAAPPERVPAAAPEQDAALALSERAPFFVPDYFRADGEGPDAREAADRSEVLERGRGAGNPQDEQERPPQETEDPSRPGDPYPFLDGADMVQAPDEAAASPTTVRSVAPIVNPQTARRRGIDPGGRQPGSRAPQQIGNPQTLRRRGTTAGPAFGGEARPARARRTP